ncbi:transposase [Chryseobacterium cucumeris]|uniref:helix-turn-helix domain-containing protein n=1 Tax=Chryseobacterium cucumeris TaxID=1813611 RepID=UPI0007899A79|nr:helix-turn-helix domain-containing protein [Chryseobacterium cucumeris]KYH06602.1 transposase [Chryseobacterium cucumeris]
MGKPNYNKIYSDIIQLKFPDKLLVCQKLLDKKELSVLDVIELNRKLFETSDLSSEKFNQKLRSYDRRSILRMLDYQRDNKLNNSQLATHFNLSRNTVTVWKKRFLVKNKK